MNRSWSLVIVAAGALCLLSECTRVRGPQAPTEAPASQEGAPAAATEQAAGAVQPQPQPQPQPASPERQAPSHEPAAPPLDAMRVSGDVGLCTDLLLVPSEKRRQLLEMIKPFGKRMLRETFRWADMEPAKGEIRWERTDSLVADVQAAGHELLAILMAAPTWAGGVELRFGAYPPVSPDLYAKFVETVAARYKGRIAAYELWNEPNMPRFWGGKEATPAEFVALLKAGYQAGKKADPNAIFVMGGLTRLVEDQDFVLEVFRLGGLNFCDVVGVHLYPDNVDAFFTQLDRLQAALENMAPPRKVWVTETGWASREIDLQKFAKQLEARGISRDTFSRSVVLRRAVGHVYEFNEQEALKAQDEKARQQEYQQLGVTEAEVERISAAVVRSRNRQQVENLYRISAYLEKTDLIEKIFWYRFEDRIAGAAKEANFGLVDFGGTPKLSYRLMAGRLTRRELEAATEAEAAAEGGSL